MDQRAGHLIFAMAVVEIAHLDEELGCQAKRHCEFFRLPASVTRASISARNDATAMPFLHDGLHDVLNKLTSFFDLLHAQLVLDLAGFNDFGRAVQSYDILPNS